MIPQINYGGSGIGSHFMNSNKNKNDNVMLVLLEALYLKRNLIWFL